MAGSRMHLDLLVLAAAAWFKDVGCLQFNCYSCMTTEFQRLLNEKQTFYHKQHSFDDRCARERIAADDGIPTIPCATVCLHLWDYRVDHSFGTAMPAKHIRGCLDSIFDPRYYRGNETYAYALTQLHRKTCPVINVEKLIIPHGSQRLSGSLYFNRGQYRTRHPDHTHNTGSIVNSCLCYGDLCNAADSGVARISIGPRIALLNLMVVRCFVTV